MEYSYLKDYAEKMQQVADECVERVLKGQSNGIYQIKVSNLKKEFDMDSMDDNLLLDMLSERQEISITDYCDGMIDVEVMPEYLAQNDDEISQTISPDEIQVKLARHYLWLVGEYGGEQADFSNLYIENFNFDNANLCSAVLNGTKFVNCSFWKTSLCFAECVGTKFNSCNMTDMAADESNFHNAEFRHCRMECGAYMSANFNHAKFVQSDISGAWFHYSCIADVEWIDTDSSSAHMHKVSNDYDEWEQKNNAVPNLEM